MHSNLLATWFGNLCGTVDYCRFILGVIVSVLALYNTVGIPDLFWIGQRYYHNIKSYSHGKFSSFFDKIVLPSKVFLNYVTWIGMTAPKSSKKHMNNQVYFQEFERGRTNWFIRHNFSKYSKEIQNEIRRDFQNYEISQTLRFRKELKPFQQFDIETTLLNCKTNKDEQTANLYFEQRLVSKKVCEYPCTKYYFILCFCHVLVFNHLIN